MTSFCKRNFFLASLLLVASIALAQGGPPLRTDDPGTPGSGNWEINVAVTSERRTSERTFEAPLLDVNYGLGNKLQLKFEIPLVVSGANGEPTKGGLGNSLLGVKWRWLEDKRHDLDISTYPQLELNNPTSSLDRGLVERGPRFLLPVEIAKKLGPIDVNGEVGYWFARPGECELISGLAIGHQTTTRLELLAEVYSITASDDHEATFGGGARYKLRDHLKALIMAGRSFHGASSGQPQFIGYFGLQFLIEKPKSHTASRHSPADR